MAILLAPVEGNLGIMQFVPGAMGVGDCDLCNAYRGGGNFSAGRNLSGKIFPIIFNDCGAIFRMLFFGHQVQNLYPVRGGGGMIGGGECRIKYVMWMYGLVRFCIVCYEYCCNQHRVLSFRALQAAYHM